jgi:putative Mg2+ transporter-C (MgtC) family protein
MALSLELQLDLCLRVLVAALLSMVIGFERERSGQSAGLRTHMLVGLGAALFTVLSLFAFGDGDPGRVAAQIVTGIGFLGAGAIIQRRDAKHPHGLTTAAGIWAVAAVGMACGTGLYVLAGFTTLLIVVVLSLLARLSDRINPRTSTSMDGEAGDVDELHRRTGGKEQQTR